MRVVLLDPYRVAVAGTRVVLAPYRRRVTLLHLAAAMDDPTQVDVILYEPVRQTAAAQITLRDLVRGSGAPVAIYSWEDPNWAKFGSFAGHISKALPVEELVSVLEHLHQTGDVVPSRPVSPSSDALSVIKQAESRAHHLTPREAEVLSLITQGMTNAEICLRLNLSLNSVKTNIRHAYRKIGAQRRAQAVLWGIEHNLSNIEAPPAQPTADKPTTVATPPSLD